MKKNTKIVLNLILTLILILLGSTTVKAGYMGDVNSDNVVDSEDSRLILRKAVGYNVYFTNTQRLQADMDGDGRITAADARLALRAAVDNDELKFRASNGKKFTMYKQDNWRYNNASYPARGGTVGKKGCGPACCCIVGSGYGYTYTPASLVSNGRNYSEYNYIRDFFAGNKTFVVTHTYSMTDTEIKNKLKAGHQIILLSKGGYIGSYYCSVNHWITLLDINSAGQVFIGDPLTKGGGWFYLNEISSKTNLICIKKR